MRDDLSFFDSRDVAQPGSALAWGARGREFESRRPDQLSRDTVWSRWVRILHWNPKLRSSRVRHAALVVPLHSILRALAQNSYLSRNRQSR